MHDQHHCTDGPLDHLWFHEAETSRRILGVARLVDRDNAAIGILSTGEQCAVALALNRPDLAKKIYGTLLECAIRVGPERLAAAAFVQANGWTQPAELDPERLRPLTGATLLGFHASPA